MASTYLADNYRDPMPADPSPMQLVRFFRYTMVTAGFIINDVVKLGPIKALTGCYLMDFYIDVPALDTSTGVIFAVGDNTTAAKYITGSIVGRSSAGGKITSTSTGVVLAGMPATYTADNDFALKVTTAPTTTTTSGIFKGWYEYYYYGTALTL
jgi:hypothetical protein